MYNVHDLQSLVMCLLGEVQLQKKYIFMVVFYLHNNDLTMYDSTTCKKSKKVSWTDTGTLIMY